MRRCSALDRARSCCRSATTCGSCAATARPPRSGGAARQPVPGGVADGNRARRPLLDEACAVGALTRRGSLAPAARRGAAGGLRLAADRGHRGRGRASPAPASPGRSARTPRSARRSAWASRRARMPGCSMSSGGCTAHPGRHRRRRRRIAGGRRGRLERHPRLPDRARPARPVAVTRVIDGPDFACKEIVFSVDEASGTDEHRSFFTTYICRDGDKWRWATAEPATARWCPLQ